MAARDEQALTRTLSQQPTMRRCKWRTAAAMPDQQRIVLGFAQRVGLRLERAIQKTDFDAQTGQQAGLLAQTPQPPSIGVPYLVIFGIAGNPFPRFFKPAFTVLDCHRDVIFSDLIPIQALQAF